MKMNLRYSILLVLLMAGAVCIPSLAQVRKYPQQDISFTEYLNRVGKSNLGYLAERLNVSIADAETVAQKVLPDPELEFEAGSDNFSLGLSYSLELGNKRGSRIRLARSRPNLKSYCWNRAFRI